MSEQVTDERRAAELIANFIQGGSKGREELELDAWLQADESRLELFDRLTSGNAEEWKIVWFKERGVDTSFLKKKKRVEWYKPPKDPAVERAFYKGAAIASLCLLVMYFLLRLLES